MTSCTIEQLIINLLLHYLRNDNNTGCQALARNVMGKIQECMKGSTSE